MRDASRGATTVPAHVAYDIVRKLPEGAQVEVESGDGDSDWSTVGVSQNIVEASLKALVDSIDYKILKDEAKRAAKARG